MSAAASASDLERAQGLQAIRAVGGLTLSARADGAMTAIGTLHEHGGYRIKCPAARAPVLEAVLINTGGGVAGGDRVAVHATAAKASRLALTTATAERIYRSVGPATDIRITLSAEDAATLAWLPQATIVFSGASVDRSIAVDMVASARVLVAETTVYGRAASGEAMSAGSFADQWRIVRDGRMVFADATRLGGDVGAILARPAVADGAAITSLLVCVAPEAEARRDDVRRALASHEVVAGVSAWNGLLAVRLLGQRLDRLADALRGAVAALRITPLPAAWTH